MRRLWRRCTPGTGCCDLLVGSFSRLCWYSKKASGAAREVFTCAGATRVGKGPCNIGQKLRVVGAESCGNLPGVRASLGFAAPSHTHAEISSTLPTPTDHLGVFPSVSASPPSPLHKQ